MNFNFIRVAVVDIQRLMEMNYIPNDSIWNVRWHLVTHACMHDGMRIQIMNGAKSELYVMTIIIQFFFKKVFSLAFEILQLF